MRLWADRILIGSSTQRIAERGCPSVLLNFDNQIATPVGLGIGALACAYTIKIEFDRFNETKDDPLDWLKCNRSSGSHRSRLDTRRLELFDKSRRLHERDLIKFLANL